QRQALFGRQATSVMDEIAIEPFGQRPLPGTARLPCQPVFDRRHGLPIIASLLQRGEFRFERYPVGIVVASVDPRNPLQERETATMHDIMPYLASDFMGGNSLEYGEVTGPCGSDRTRLARTAIPEPSARHIRPGGLAVMPVHELLHTFHILALLEVQGWIGTDL